jgi:hypothetical protein
MSIYTALTIPTQFVEAASTRFAYRRFRARVRHPAALLHALYRNHGSLGSRVDRRICPGPREIFGARYDPADELWLRVFFTP